METSTFNMRVDLRISAVFTDDYLDDLLILKAHYSALENTNKLKYKKQEQPIAETDFVTNDR